MYKAIVISGPSKDNDINKSYFMLIYLQRKYCFSFCKKRDSFESGNMSSMNCIMDL